MALNVNTEAWGNPESWVTYSNDGDCLKYPWNRQRWTDIKSHIRSGTDLDLSIAPWLINKDSALVNLTACSWYNNYEDSSGTVINRYDIGNAYADEFNPLSERQDTPFILSMWWRDRSGNECWSPYWAYDFDTNTDTNSGYINGERFPVANFRYDKIRVVPVIALTSQDPINPQGNRSDTRYVGIPTADQIASKPYCCGIGYKIYCEKNNTMTQMLLTVDLDTHFNGFLSTAYLAGQKSYGGTSGARMARAPRLLVSSGNYYNWLFYNTVSISTNSNIIRRGSTRARDYLFTRNSWNDNTSSLGAFAGKVDGFAFNARNVQSTSGATFSGYYYMQVPDRDTLKEIVMEQLAYIGLPFVLSSSNVGLEIGNENVYLPVFYGVNGEWVTTGEYKNGTESQSLMNASWQWVYDIEPPQGGAFEDAAALSTVRIPPSVKTIGPKAFKGTALQRVRIAADCTYGEQSFPAGCVVTRYPDDRYEQLYDCDGKAVLDCDGARVYVLKEDNNNG